MDIVPVTISDSKITGHYLYPRNAYISDIFTKALKL
jgi:hypothetical protein